MKKTIGEAILEIVQGDITALAVDAIVNAANRYLAHGGGVALAIVRARAGRRSRQESDGADCPARAAQDGRGGDHGWRQTGGEVCHSRGRPGVERARAAEADRLLCQAVTSSLTLAEEKGLKSIAFPAISTGIYGFPIERAAPLMLQGKRNATSKGKAGLERILFCLYDDASYGVFESALEKI
jgi:O-acetyl-ADP-ribose deacetylase